MATRQVNGIQLECEVQGNGPALLFIHGLGGCLQDWDAQAEAFARDHQVIRFDLRGHGKSEKPAGPYSIQMFAADAAALLQSLGIARADVVGISLGGAIAFQLTLDHPQFVSSLTVVNSGPEAIVRNWKEKLGISLRYWMLHKMGVAKLGKAIAKGLFPNKQDQRLRDEFSTRFALNDAVAYEHAMRALIGWSVSDRIASIKCPVVAIAADRDYTPVSFKEAYVAKIPGAALEIVPDSHHALPVQKPEAFNAVLRKFLARASSAHAPVGQELLKRA